MNECICIVITATQATPIDVLYNYIALGCISDIDEIYFMSIKEPLKSKLIAADFVLKIDADQMDDLLDEVDDSENVTCITRILFLI